MPRALRVTVHADADKGGYWAESDDIVGLITEADTYEALRQRVFDVALDLLELNKVDIPLDGAFIDFHLEDKMPLPSAA